MTSDFMDTLRQWWLWANIETGKPRGYGSCLGSHETVIPQIAEEDALVIDAIVADFQRIDAGAHCALQTYLETGSMNRTARLLGVYNSTVQLLLERAVAWVHAKYDSYLHDKKKC